MAEIKIGIAGLGNYILRDEGFGVHTVKYLQDNFIFTDNVELTDIGTAGIYMAPFLEEHDPIFIIDVVDIEGEPGSFHHYNIEDIKASKFPMRMSPHQLGFLEILSVCKLRDAAPEHIEFFTVIPKELTESIELSDVVANQMVRVANMIVDKIKDMGFEVLPKPAIAE